MPMKSEVAISGLSAEAEAAAARPTWRHRIFASPDFQVVLIFALTGLVATAIFANFIPLSADTVATILSQTP